MKLPEGATGKDFLVNFVGAESMIDQLLEHPKTAASTAKPCDKPAAPQVKITMTPADVDALPWTASNWIRKDDKDRTAKPGEDAWLKEENADPRLVQMLKEGHGKLDLPPYNLEHKIGEGFATGLIVRHGPSKKKK